MAQKKDAPTSNQATNETAHYYHYRRRYYQFKIRESRTFAVRLPGITRGWPVWSVVSYQYWRWEILFEGQLNKSSNFFKVSKCVRKISLQMYERTSPHSGCNAIDLNRVWVCPRPLWSAAATQNQPRGDVLSWAWVGKGRAKVVHCIWLSNKPNFISIRSYYDMGVSSFDFSTFELKI